MACVTSFGVAHPRVTTELELTNRIVDLVEENIDVALRLHAGTLPGNASLMSRRLARFTRAMYARWTNCCVAGFNWHRAIATTMEI